MGNCLNTTTGCRSRSSSSYAGQKQQQVNPEDGLGSPAAEQRTGEEEGGAGGPAGGLKVKVVLTRGELEWLMAQLKSGEKRLEDVLHEMGRDRLRAAAAATATGDGEGWRPSLESIVEGPEAAA